MDWFSISLNYLIKLEEKYYRQTASHGIGPRLLFPILARENLDLEMIVRKKTFKDFFLRISFDRNWWKFSRRDRDQDLRNRNRT